VFKKRSKKFWATVTVIAAVVIFLFPALIAFRYTAASQRNDFIRRPWRGWSFVVAALTVPSNSRLKTSGQALRKAVYLYRASAVDPREIQLLFVAEKKPYRFTQQIAGRSITTSVVPAYRFIWQVAGRVDTLPHSGDVIVGLLDYDTGKLLYDIRRDLPPSLSAPPSNDTSSPSPSPSTP
jgi:hypothetical protein